MPALASLSQADLDALAAEQAALDAAAAAAVPPPPTQTYEYPSAGPQGNATPQPTPVPVVEQQTVPPPTSSTDPVPPPQGAAAAVPLPASGGNNWSDVLAPASASAAGYAPVEPGMYSERVPAPDRHIFSKPEGVGGGGGPGAIPLTSRDQSNAPTPQIDDLGLGYQPGGVSEGYWRDPAAQRYAARGDEPASDIRRLPAPPTRVIPPPDTSMYSQTATRSAPGTDARGYGTGYREYQAANPPATAPPTYDEQAAYEQRYGTFRPGYRKQPPDYRPGAANTGAGTGVGDLGFPPTYDEQAAEARRFGTFRPGSYPQPPEGTRSYVQRPGDNGQLQTDYESIVSDLPNNSLVSPSARWAPTSSGRDTAETALRGVYPSSGNWGYEDEMQAVAEGLNLVPSPDEIDPNAVGYGEAAMLWGGFGGGREAARRASLTAADDALAARAARPRTVRGTPVEPPITGESFPARPGTSRPSGLVDARGAPLTKPVPADPLAKGAPPLGPAREVAAPPAERATGPIRHDPPEDIIPMPAGEPISPPIEPATSLSKRYVGTPLEQTDPLSKSYVRKANYTRAEPVPEPPRLSGTGSEFLRGGPRTRGGTSTGRTTTPTGSGSVAAPAPSVAPTTPVRGGMSKKTAAGILGLGGAGAVIAGEALTGNQGVPAPSTAGPATPVQPGDYSPSTNPTTPDEWLGATTRSLELMKGTSPDDWGAKTQRVPVEIGGVRQKLIESRDSPGLYVGYVNENGDIIPVGNDVSPEDFEAMVIENAAEAEEGWGDAAPSVPAPPSTAPKTGTTSTDTALSGKSGTGTSGGGGTSGGSSPGSGGSSRGSGGVSNGTRYSSGSGGGSSDYSSGSRGTRGRGLEGDEGDRDFTADDFLEKAGGNRVKAQMLANMANARKRRGRMRGVPQQKSGMRDDILRSIQESLTKPKPTSR